MDRAAEARHPNNRAVADLKAQIKMRVVTDRDLQHKERGAFVFTYPKALENRPDRALESIEQDFDQVFRVERRVVAGSTGREQHEAGAAVGQYGGYLGDFGLACGDRGEHLGLRSDLVVVWLLAEAVERVAGEELGARHHVLEVLDRHDLRRPGAAREPRGQPPGARLPGESRER